MAARTHCPRNHEYDERNTYIDRVGKRHCRACRRDWKRTDRGRAYGRIYKPAWRKANPFKGRAEDCRRRAKMFGASGDASAKQIEARVAYFGERCWLCRGQYEQVDHVLPLSLGGSNFPSNIRPICERCNLAKGARHPKELVAA